MSLKIYTQKTCKGLLKVTGMTPFNTMLFVFVFVLYLGYVYGMEGERALVQRRPHTK